MLLHFEVDLEKLINKAFYFVNGKLINWALENDV